MALSDDDIDDIRRWEAQEHDDAADGRRYRAELERKNSVAVILMPFVVIYLIATAKGNPAVLIPGFALVLIGLLVATMPLWRKKDD